MTLLAPIFLALAGLAAAITVVLHLLAVRRPQEYTLPTARFVPAGAVRATSMARTPTDILLLLLRIATLLLIGAALARPILQPERSDLGRVLLVDRSAAVANDNEVMERLSALAREGDLVLQFADSALPVVTVSDPAGIQLAPVSATVGSLTTALLSGQRAAAVLGDSAERVEIVLISPLVQEQWDAGTQEALELWPGAIRLERLRAATTDSARSVVMVQLPDGEGAGSDPVAAGAALAGKVALFPIVIARTGENGGSASGTSSATRSILVRWPVSGVPNGWTVREVRDTVSAVVAYDFASGNAVRAASTLAGPFERSGVAPDLDGDTRAIAWWSDGEVAAVQRSVSEGCVREVGIALPDGDLALRPSFARFLAALSVPCDGGVASLTPVADSLLQPFTNRGETAVPFERSSATDLSAAPLVPWLLAGALALLGAEWVVRRRQRGMPEAAA